MGSRFEEENQDRLWFHSKDIMDNHSVKCLPTIQLKGKKQYRTFVDERLHVNIKPIAAIITRNKVVLFNGETRKSQKTGTPVSLLKSESSLCDRLYVACQTTDGNLNIFFQTWKSSISTIPFMIWTIASGEKIRTHGLSWTSCSPHVIQDPRQMWANILRPGGCKTTGDYASNVFVPHIKREQKSLRSRYCLRSIL